MKNINFALLFEIKTIYKMYGTYINIDKIIALHFSIFKFLEDKIFCTEYSKPSLTSICS